jgi:adenylylsulfate kinase-like enzyme
MIGPVRTGPIPLLWLCGPPGAGKSSVGWDIYSRLARDGARAAFADVDQFGICYPEPPSDPGRYRMKERNLAAAAEGFRAAGSECVVVSGVVDPVQGIPASAVPGADVTLCLVTAAHAELERRLARRGDTADAVAVALYVAAALDGGNFAATRVDTTELTVAEVARLIPARCGGWPGHRRAEPENASPSPEAATPDTAGLDGRVLLVCGATGTGKSAVGFEVYRRLLAAGMTAAYADLDQLGFCHPDPDGDPGRHRLKARNLASLWRTYHAVGARFLVATGPIPDSQALGAYTAALPSADITVCRLHAGPAVLLRRIESRGRGESWAQPGDPLRGQSAERLRKAAARAAVEAKLLDGAGVGDIRVDTSTLTIEQTANQLQRFLLLSLVRRAGGTAGRGLSHHGTGAGTNLPISPATTSGLSTGTHVLAPGTETSVARGKSDASRRACAIGKKPHDSPQISSTGRSNRGITSAASTRSCGRKPAMAATRSSSTRGSRRADARSASARSLSSPLAVTDDMPRRRTAGDRSCSQNCS